MANPIDEDRQLDATLHDEALVAALAHAAASGAVGKDVTPAVLAEFARFTGGASVQVNRDLVVANAALAGQIAVALARLVVTRRILLVGDVMLDVVVRHSRSWHRPATPPHEYASRAADRVRTWRWRCARSWAIHSK